MLMQKPQVTARGIVVDESKRGRENLIEWTPTLRKIVGEAMARARTGMC